MADKTILFLNPNSSASVTQILQVKLSSYATPGVRLKFTNPSAGPSSIDDQITSALSVEASWKFLGDEGLLNDESIVGIIVCCCQS
jgi:Asp/Glu/hydantoin racemase